MYNEQLERLIELALMDGELTEKEKQILFRKAESFGIDLDEFEMVLEGRLLEMQKSTPKIEQPSITMPQTNKNGDVKKCPACGAIAPPFSVKCPDCGHEFRNVEASNSVQKLFQMLDEVESQRDDKVTAAGVIGGMFKSGVGGGILAQALGGGSKTDKRKKEIISSFPIPNTKEDILEFLSLAFSKAKTKGNIFTKANTEYVDHNEFAPTWRAKCEQVIMKARFSMKDDRKTLDEINDYAKNLGIK